MKKKNKKKIIVIAAVVVAVAVGAVVITTVTAGADQPQFETTYGTDTATIGSISLTVSGSGNLGSAKTLSIEAESHLDINEMLVYEGDTVQEGQPVATLDIEAMQSYAQDLKGKIDTIQTQIDTTNSVTTRLSIKSPVDGWVKNAVLDEDDYIEDAMSEYGYVALVATEKREIINAQDSSLSEGDEVRVKCEGKWFDGVVTSENGGLYVSIDVVSRTVGADALVTDTSGNELFTGQIELAAYVPIESSYGTITDVKFSENDSIEAGETIYSAEQFSIDVQDLYDSLEDMRSEYDTVLKLIEAGQITAPAAGVVNALNISDGQTCDEGTALMTLDSTSDFIATVSVDELDINSIEAGQSVSVTLDSMPNDVFSGTVSRISDMGSASGGITTYNVEVSIESNESFKLGMSVSCEITAQEAANAVLVPVDDVLTTNSKSYVMVAVDRTEAEKSAIKQLIEDGDYTNLMEYMGEDATALNIMRLTDPAQLLYAEIRAVETGIENAYYIEIKSGLSEGEKVLAQSTDSDSSQGGFIFMDGGGMAGGIQGLSEARQRPDSGGPGGNFGG